MTEMIGEEENSLESLGPIGQILMAESQKIITGEDDTDWWEEPVSFRRFVTDSFYLNMPALTEAQYGDIEMFIGDDPRLTFTTKAPFNLFCLVAGKGSGKDYLASILIAYFFYLLMCMRNTHKFLDWPPGESIDMLVVRHKQ